MDLKDNKKKTVGIMTFHWAANYGAVLQSWALQKFLCNEGYQAEVIDYVPQDLKQSLIKCFLTRRLSKMKSRISEYRKEKKIKLFRATQIHTSGNHYNNSISLMNNAPEYDVYLSGSDQIWNPSFTMERSEGINKCYYLGFAKNEKRRVAFSSSFGCSEISDGMKNAIKPELQKYYRLSVREMSGVEILNSMQLSAVCTADPTFLLHVDEYKSLFQIKKNKKNSLYAYVLHGQYDYLKSISKNIASLLDLEIEREAECTVEEWLNYIYTAEFVITNSFHCVVFSLLFHTPFLAFDVKGMKMSDRLVTLLERVGLSECFVSIDDMNATSDNFSIALETIDWQSVDDRVEMMRKEAISYLKEALES